MEKIKKYYNKTVRNRRGGFTLIETFVAITILMIAILGPMSILSKALSAANLIKNQTIANYLAQEGMEIVMAQRNYIYSMNLSDIENMKVKIFNYFSGLGTDPLYLDTSQTIGSDSLLIPCSNGCPIYIDNNGIYNSVGGDSTVFVRKINISTEKGTPDKIQVTVTVSWNQGTYQTQTVTNQTYLYESI
jgi:type II secretory pathway pseudopilin PulG